MKVLFHVLQIESAAEEPRVLCIVQDTTNAKTVNERLTLNLPASTPLSKLFEDVAHKAGYVNGTFELAWGSVVETVSYFTTILFEYNCRHSESGFVGQVC